MNEGLRLTALFVRDLTGKSENMIRIGRLGFDIDDFDAAYVGVDALGAARRLSSGERYNGVTEIMTHDQRYSMPVTVTFYGATAWNDATLFSLMIKSQKALEIQESIGISIFQTSQITDVKMITGQQHGERVEINLNAHYSVSYNADTMRIDVEQISTISD